MIRQLRLAARALLRAPGFTMAAVLCIALGVGANTAVFSALDAVLLRPLDVPDLDRMVVVKMDLPKLSITDGQLGPPESAEVLARADLFDAGAALQSRRFTLADDRGSESQRIAGARTLGDFFTLLGGRPTLGRYYTPDASTQGAKVAVLSHAFWRDRFGADRGIVGRTIRLNGVAYEVVGVASPAARYPRTAQVWMPYPVDSSFAGQRGRMYMDVVGRLRPGVTQEELGNQLALESRRWMEKYGDGYDRSGLALHALPLRDALAGDLRPILVALVGAVALVLLIACANVACLQLVRAAGRARELAVRAALGAERGRLAGVLVAESVMIAALGGALGVALGSVAVWSLRMFGPARFPALQAVRLDVPVLAFAVGVTTLAAVVFGLAPALRVMYVDPQTALRANGGRGMAGGAGQQRTLRTAVVGQIALALALMLGAGVVARSLGNLIAVDPGFRPDEVLSAQIALAGEAYGPVERRVAFHDQVVAKLRASAGVLDAATVSYLPFTGGSDSSPFTVVGRSTPAGGEPPHANYNIVTPGLFRTLGMTMVSGRDFDANDRRTSAPVAIVDEQLARLYFPGQNAVGQHIKTWSDPIEIVGVVRSVKQEQLGAADKATIYYPHTQNVASGAAIVVRSALPAPAVERLIRAAVTEQDRLVPVFDVKPLRRLVDESLGARRLAATVFGAFAALSLVLAALGIYGVLSYAVAQRTRELGIRAALGAGRGEVSRLVLRQGARLAVAGLSIGTVAFLVLGRGLEALVFGVGPRDPLTLVAGVSVLGAAALLASWIPARRAARIDPAISLRAE